MTGDSSTSDLALPTLMDIRQIMEYLPHRYPFLLIDRVLSAVPGQRLRAQKNVSMNEPFFQGHFPNRPIMPGVLVLEAMAQSAAVLSFLTADSKPTPNTVYYFVGIDGARFKKPVTPGDVLIFDIEIVRASRGIWKYSAKATVDGQLVTEAELMCTVRESAE